MVRLPPGSKVDRFEIKSLIGSGGMGTLYLARDTSPSTYRLVALKVLNASLATEDLRDRFTREARALASLNHPNVVHIHETGDFRGSPYIVMEYVSGETIAEKIGRKAPLSLRDKLKLMMDLCAGLAHAHDVGIIHRDIKPANLMVDHHGRLRLLDFGIARVSTGTTVSGSSTTLLNVRLGTPGYMSPEQYRGAEIDRRSDIFAVGTVFYELLAYSEAFPGETTQQVEKSVLQSEPERLTSRIAGLDPEIAALVSRALEKNPDKRFQDAGEMERALGKVWRRLGLDESGQTIRRPAPSPGEGRKASRAEAAYQRAKSALEQGAPEAARRYVLEAVAEDFNHPGARRLLQQQDPAFRLPPPPPPPPPRDELPIEATIVSSRADVLRSVNPEETIVSSPVRRPPPPKRPGTATVVTTERGSARTKGKTVWRWPTGVSPWRLTVTAAAIVLVIAAAALVVMVIRGSSSGANGDGLTLTVKRPTNGTIVGAGIECGTKGSLCDVSLAQGAMVELTLQPDDGFAAAGFTNDCAQGGQFRMTSNKTCGATFTPSVPSGEVSVTPSVERVTLTVYPGEGGEVIVGDLRCRGVSQCQWAFPKGQELDLDAKPDAGYAFQRFDGGCDRDGLAIMKDHVTCGAIFERDRGPAATLTTTSKPGLQNAAKKPPEQVKTVAQGPDPTGSSEALKNASSNKPAEGTTAKPVAPGDNAAKEQQATIAGGIPPPPPPTPSEEELAKKAITDVLESYRKAYEGLSFEGMRAVYPTVNPGIVAQLKGLAKVKLSYSGPPKIELDSPGSPTTAVAEVAVSRIELAKGQTKETQSPVKVLLANLHRRTQNNNWVIEKVTFAQ